MQWMALGMPICGSREIVKSPKNISKGLEKYYFRAKEPRHGQGAIQSRYTNIKNTLTLPV